MPFIQTKMNKRFMRRIFIMAGTQSEKTPLARLMLFMVCLSIAGSIVAGLHYYAVDLPEQNAQALLEPRNNQELKAACNICIAGCQDDPDVWACEQTCDPIC
jgi:hypothetical protein